MDSQQQHKVVQQGKDYTLYTNDVPKFFLE